MIGNVEKILDISVSGFHRYILDDNIRLGYASRNLCALTGFSKEELLDEKEGYYSIVHPSDRECYLNFLSKLKSGAEGETFSCRYRIIKKNGSEIFVNDTSTLLRLEDGELAGDSVLSDITELYRENLERGAIPYGRINLCFSRSFRASKITYISDGMARILRIPQENKDSSGFADMYRENIYLIISPEERKNFSNFLECADESSPVEIIAARYDGTRSCLLCWIINRCDCEEVEEISLAFIDVTECRRTKNDREATRYIKALEEVYDGIFECDFANDTVKYIGGSDSSIFGRFEEVPMNLKSIVENAIENMVATEDKENVRNYFYSIYKNRTSSFNSDFTPIRYSASSTDGAVKSYAGIMIKADENVYLYCCRKVPGADEAKLLKKENVSLKENIRGLASHFSEGIAAFEINGELVKPLYSSDNVCEFFGFNREEWNSIMNIGVPLKQLIARGGISMEKFNELIDSGKSEFSYFDLSARRERRIKAICSARSSAGSAPFYIMLYNVDGESDSDKTPESNVTIRTFGYFDVFVNGKPIAFRNKKSKELLALLVDRRGGYVTSDEAISFLWEEEPVNAVTLARYRKVALRLKNILEEYGIPDIVESVDGKRRIVADKVNCDLYDYLSGNCERSQLFKGSYLTNYSWGENTLAELTNEIIF